MKIYHAIKVILLLVLLSIFSISNSQSPDEYQKAIQMADKYFMAGDYINAKASYQYALKIKPDEQYPKDKLQETIGLIKVQMEKSVAYEQKIQVADDLYKKKDYTDAIQAYKNALEIVPADQYATDRMHEIESLQNSLRQTEEEYSLNIKSGDQLFQKKEYDKALESFRKANNLKPDEQYPLQKIKEIETLINAKNAAASEYEKALQDAETMASKKEYDRAITLLEGAIRLRPDEQAPQKRLEEIKKIKADYESYQALIDEADNLYVSRDFERAKGLYSEAHRQHPDDSYPSNMIDKIDIILMDVSNLNESTFEATIAKADKFFNEKDYNNAMIEYNKALVFKPDEKYVKQRISDINNIVEFRKTQEDAYTQSIAKADKLFNEKNYSEAREEYQHAKEFKSLESYPDVKINEIDNILAALNNKKDQYDKLIKGADKLFFADDYSEAREQYRTASQLMPNEQYPKDQIAMITEILGQRDTYTKAITRADKYLGKKDLDSALMEYRKAATARPDEEYPNQQIAQIERLKSDQIKLFEISTAYDTAIDEADRLFASQKYEQARMSYKKALEIKSGEQYPVEKLEQIDNIFADQAAQAELKKQYDGIILNADKLFAAKDYQNAKASYRQALDLKVDLQYPKEKITEIDEVLADQLAEENRQKQYDLAITNADKLFASKDYVSAKTVYSEALQLKPNEEYPQERLAETDNILAGLAAQADLQKQFDQLIAKGDQMLLVKDYSGARTEYQQALALKPDESYPKDKSAEIDKILTDIAAKEEIQKQYDAWLANANRLVEAKDYENAKKAYQSAASLKPDEKLPKDGLARIDALMAEMAAQADLQKQFDAAITNGDKALGARDYQAAKASYAQALALKPDEQYPRDKVAEIEKILADQLARENQQKQYDLTIANADKLFGGNDFEGAKAVYMQALQLKPGEQYPQDRITETDKILADLAAKAEIQKQYGQLISNGDKALLMNDYAGAKLAYQQALALKPDELYPKDKSTEIDKILADISAKEDVQKKFDADMSDAGKLLEAKDYDNAKLAYQDASMLKPDEKLPKDKIAEIDNIIQELAAKEALQKQYDLAIANGDKAFGAKDYQDAKSFFEKALTFKPDEQYPKDRITETDGLIADQLAKENLQKQYDLTIANADKLFGSNDFNGAKSAYTEALQLKPGEKYPQDRLSETNNILADLATKAEIQKQYDQFVADGDRSLMMNDYPGAKQAYQKALTLKPDESYPKDKCADIDKILADITAKEEIQKKYDAAIANANKLEESKDYENAKLAYQEASNLKPEEKIPKEKVAEIEVVITEIAAKAEIQKQYDQAIANANSLYDAKDYEGAQKAYEQASKLKPDETVPKDKLKEVAIILVEQAKEREIKQKYDEAISYADKHLNNKDYANARYEYQVANSVKPDEQYPLQKLAEIDRLLAEIAKQKEIDGKYNHAIEQADLLFKELKYEEARLSYEESLTYKPGSDYPSKQVVEINRIITTQAIEKQKAYDLAIVKADNYFQQEDFEMAKTSYERAIELKPDEVYPLDRLKVVNDLILKKRQLLQEEYDKAIADADKFYASKIYDNAIDSYRVAMDLKPKEGYPGEMIKKILKLISERMIVNINKELVRIPDNTTKRFDFSPVPVKDRKANYVFFKARNPKEVNFKVIVNFGKDQTKNGGMVVKIPKNVDINDFIVRISAQYKWFSEDNNWISFYPEGGDLEVSLVQISYSD